MELNIYKDLNDRGLFKFYDGTIIYVEEIQYSADGKTHWENTFNPSSHTSTVDYITIVDGHKYRRTRNAGETRWNYPSLWVPENGQESMIRVEGDILQWKLELDTIWIDLYDLSTLKGEQGEQGIEGKGWQVDRAGALDIRPSCCGGNTPISNPCNACNPNSVQTCGTLSTYMALGNHILNLEDVGTGTNRWHSFDGVTFVQSTSDDIGTYVLAWQATAAPGTNALTCNRQGIEVSLASLVTPYDSTGKVYICTDGLWTELFNVTTPTGLVKVEDNDVLGYLENKLDNVTLESYDSDSNTINDTIRIKDNGVNEYKIISTTLSDGLDGGSGTKISVDPTDFIGFGLSEYTSTNDGLDDIQVLVDDLISDGLAVEDRPLEIVDGETRHLIRIEPSDIVTSVGTNYTGLETSTERGITEVDNYDNIYIKENDCLEIDTNGLNVVADELTILAEGLSQLEVAETDSNTLGIQAKHIHKNMANELHGIEKDNDTTGSFSVKLDTIESPQPFIFNVNGEIALNENGVQGKHLNDNTCNTLRGINVQNDRLEVKVDNTTIGFNGSGELTVTPANIGNAVATTTDVVVKSITVNDNGTPGNTVRDNIIYRVNEGGGIDTSISADSPSDTITLNIAADEAWFDARYEPLGGNTPVDVYWQNLERTSSNPQTIIQYIDDLKHVELNKIYGNMIISDGSESYNEEGLLLLATGGKIFKLIVDNNGNLDTILVN